MLLTKDGRFDDNSFYTEAPRFSQDNAYDSSLFTAVKNALYQNFGITTRTLLKWKPNYSKTGNLPEDVKKYIKTPGDSVQPQAAPQTPADQSAQPATDESAYKVPTPEETVAKLKSFGVTRKISQYDGEKLCSLIAQCSDHAPGQDSPALKRLLNWYIEVLKQHRSASASK